MSMARAAARHGDNPLVRRPADCRVDIHDGVGAIQAAHTKVAVQENPGEVMNLRDIRRASAEVRLWRVLREGGTAQRVLPVGAAQSFAGCALVTLVRHSGITRDRTHASRTCQEARGNIALSHRSGPGLEVVQLICTRPVALVGVSVLMFRCLNSSTGVSCAKTFTDRPASDADESRCSQTSPR